MVSGPCEVVATGSNVGSGAPPLTGAVTVIAAVPVFVSLVAVIVARPAPLPVTRPVVLTVAIEALLLDHVIVRPDSVLPLASFGVAVSCTVCPTSRLAAGGVTATVATGTWVTVMVEAPVLPSLVAVMVAEPAATPVTRPVLPFTVDAEVLELVHVIVRPVRMLPFASFKVAVSWSVCPTVRLPEAGLTVTDDTGTGAGADTITRPIIAVPCTAQS